MDCTGIGPHVYESRDHLRLSSALPFLGAGGIAGIPTPVILMLLVFVGFYLLLNYTVVGRSVYSVGANMSASVISGIRVKRTLLIVYTLSGLFAAFAGMVYISRLMQLKRELENPSCCLPSPRSVLAERLFLGAKAGSAGRFWGQLL